MDAHLGKLRWRCRRGMKELDLLTLGYLDRYYPHAAPEAQSAFAALLELQDPQLIAYMVGRESPTDPAILHVVEVMRRVLLEETSS